VKLRPRACARACGALITFCGALITFCVAHCGAWGIVARDHVVGVEQFSGPGLGIEVDGE
jgi:hypothetical protein